LFIVAGLAPAKTVDIPNENATLDIPDAWTVHATPQAAGATPVQLLTALSPDTNSAVVVLVMDNAEGITADNASFVDGVKNGITRTTTSQGGTVQFQGSETVTLGGAPATCIQYTQTPSGRKPINCRLYEIGANGKMYSLVFQTLDATQDPAQAAIAATLKFASPPVLPTPRADDQAGKWGMIVGAFVGGLAAFATIRWLARRKKA
jgi:hypothetical protein